MRRHREVKLPIMRKRRKFSFFQYNLFSYMVKEVKGSFFGGFEYS